MSADVLLASQKRLPQLRTRLVGRERETEEISRLLRRDDISLLTLLGPGGVGKTRLALRVLEQLRPSFADGALFVPLVSVRDPDLVLPAIARALGLREAAGAKLCEIVQSVLSVRELLLLLDNFEQIVAAAPVVADLLAGCPKLTILATSRISLQISGEYEYPVSPFQVADLPDNPTIEDLDRFDALRLFVLRSQSVKPEFALTDENGPAVVEICRRLDGVPLAIELAAARVKVLSPAALTFRLSYALPLLTGGGRELPPHQQTMRSTIAWSYDLLTPGEQQFFRHLAVFSGGFTLEAFEQVCGHLASPELDTFSALTSLVNNSLVRFTETSDGTPRYMMLETIREFAEEKLLERGEDADARQRHVDWCLDFTRDAPSGLRQVKPFEIQELGAEYPNFRSALTWLDASDGQEDLLLTLASNLGYFWYLADYEPEGLDWLRRAIVSADDELCHDYIHALILAGHLATTLGDASAREYLERGRSLALASGNIPLLAQGTIVLGISAEDHGEFEEAETLMSSGWELAQQAGLDWAECMALYHLGIIASGRGELESARTRLEAARASARALDDMLLPYWSLPHLALIACQQADPMRAAEYLHEGLLTVQSSGLRQGDEVLLGAFAVLATMLEEFRSSAELLGAAAARNYDIPYFYPERTAFLQAEASARRQLGAADFDTAWIGGRTMRSDSITTEMERLLSIAANRPVPRQSDRASSILTAREQEVLQLLIDGRSNRDIAEMLFISHRTATTHVTHILAKFGVETRAAAVTYAFQHDLT